VGRLSKDEQKLLEQLEARRDAPDEPDVDVEIWEGDKGARMPLSKAAGWLGKTLGINLGPDDDDGQDGDDGDGQDGDDQPKDKARPKVKLAGKDTGSRSPAVRRFGARAS
jgi:hypothetical protein